MSAEGPIAIGGLGGSGTRVVADMVAALGVDLGRDLNQPRDNLSFTLLFKRPFRFAYAGGLVDERDTAAAAAARTFEAAMTHRGLRMGDVLHIARAAADVGLHSARGDVAEPNDRHSRRARSMWAARRGTRIVAGLSSKATPSRWGWKEPNTFVFLPALYRQMPGLRYLHVVRNGLDMAFSANDSQLRNWGGLYGVGPVADGDRAVAQLRYWARANTTVADYLLGRPHSHTIRYEDVTGRPSEALEELSAALDAPLTADARELATTLRPSRSTGRHLDHDVGALVGRAGEEVAVALARFGYR